MLKNNRDEDWEDYLLNTSCDEDCEEFLLKNNHDKNWEDFLVWLKTNCDEDCKEFLAGRGRGRGLGSGRCREGAVAGVWPGQAQSLRWLFHLRSSDSSMSRRYLELSQNMWSGGVFWTCNIEQLVFFGVSIHLLVFGGPLKLFWLWAVVDMHK
ncbi:uncharacterized protein LOC130793813 isoform X2 [Actinidia eriantha]|uniref:uncharacterized protein LOC130793813 isoform X2 n=1 Tax=Actinidia eriantha TaxID=165200 RepID=UPI002583F19C|nr:uncharacterized protein LOC130793813 isoform X2 [Actinidia eriantha]